MAITKKRNSIEDRWTPLIVSAGGFVPISVFFLDNYHRLPRPLTNREALLVVHLIRHKYDDRAPFPALSLLARKMGVSMTAVRNQMRSLESKGYLRREPRKATSNAYHLDGLFAALERLIVASLVRNTAPQARSNSSLSPDAQNDSDSPI